MSAYAAAMAALMSDIRRTSGRTVERDARETRIVLDGHAMARVPSTDDALADVLRASQQMALDVIACHAEACGLGGEA